MNLTFLELCGFRGYRNRVRISFADQFTIIDGRNGVGKSTIFDAVEFALTGTISKYRDAKASGETVADYLWWTGQPSTSTDRYVEIGLLDDGVEYRLRRGQFEEPPANEVQAIAARLCDKKIAPLEPLSQLCAAAIIRDEHITSLSLDLRETDRYTLLRDALGANDADTWITRAEQIVSVAKKRTATASKDVGQANGDVASATRRLDEIRAGISSESFVSGAVQRLRTFAATSAPVDQLSGPTRERVAALTMELDSLARIKDQKSSTDAERQRVTTLREAAQVARDEKQVAQATLRLLPAAAPDQSSTALAAQARSIIALVALGRKLGLHDGSCPLCAKGQSREEFEEGLDQAEAHAQKLDENAARAAGIEHHRQAAQDRLATATAALAAAETALEKSLTTIAEYEQRMSALGIERDAPIEKIELRIADLRQTLETPRRDLRILDTLRLNPELERGQRVLTDVQARLARAQERFGRARKAEANARALHDSARRAASETLDRRLERVLPLMSELYRRLRPHPFWSDIEYSIRGDVRRFLALQVGDGLNPQFLFSSGQRRATGLAFLLSVNLSLAWSRWRSILLDDPVQHVDDFRTVHLAELMAQLVSEGRQVICAVEDAALADLLCRRLPISKAGSAKRITLGPDHEGALAIAAERDLTPLPARTLITAHQPSSAAG